MTQPAPRPAGVPVPLVSVVVPTRHRPELLLSRALRTALAQTLGEIEVIVVVDGPDPATLAALAGVDDPRLRVVALPQNVGPSEARNIGVRHARAEWVALLDDDDEWAPAKLARQREAALASGLRHPIVVCRYDLPEGQTTRQEPARFPREGEPLADYLMARESWLSPNLTLMSTVMFAGRDLFEKMPFRSGLYRHEDWDWLIWASRVPGAGVVGVGDVLATYHFHEARPHLGTSVSWRPSLAWARDLRAQGLMSDRAFVGFVVFHVAHFAAQSGQPGALRETAAAVLGARPRAFELARFAATWLLPQERRRHWRLTAERLLTRRRPSAARGTAA